MIVLTKVKSSHELEGFTIHVATYRGINLPLNTQHPNEKRTANSIVSSTRTPDSLISITLCSYKFAKLIPFSYELLYVTI